MKLLTYADMLARPPQEWLVDGLIPEGSLCMIYGPSGHGKSFIALDVAHSVATGRAWLGHRIKAGPALYVLAEGVGGFPKRLAAWCEAKGMADPGPIRYIAEPVEFHDRKKIQELCELLEREEHRPSLIVVDTLHASLNGGNENDQTDMGIFVDGCKALITAFGCSVILIHHTGWDTSRERGSSSTRAALDVKIKVHRLAGSNIEVRTEKERDCLPPLPFTVRLRAVGDSMVPDLIGEGSSTLTANQRKLLSALEDGLVRTRKECSEASGLRKSTCDRTRDELLEMDAIVEVEKSLQITDQGLALLENDSDESQVPKRPVGPNGTGTSRVPPVPTSLDVGLGLGAGTPIGPLNGDAQLTAEGERQRHAILARNAVRRSAASCEKPNDKAGR